MKVLVPFDGSESSENAVKYVLNMAKDHKNMQVTVITVSNVADAYHLSSVPLNVRELIDLYKEKVKENLEEVKKLFEKEGVPVETVFVESGDVAKVIVDTVKQGNFDRIVMGTRGLSKLKGLFLGSVSAKVIANVDIPVTLIK
ncbi:universal stress protein [Peptococcaceae bacterium]|nr:universal stress protein [Peptococcaceae bacterium]